MKFSLILALALFSGSSMALADSGQYVCGSVNSGGTGQDVQKLLNSLGCDVALPFSVAIAGNGYIVACCVQK